MNHVLEHSCGDLLQGWLLLEKYPGCRTGVHVPLRFIPERSQIPQLQSSSHASRGKIKYSEEECGGGGEGQHPMGEWAVPGQVRGWCCGTMSCLGSH